MAIYDIFKIYMKKKNKFMGVVEECTWLCMDGQQLLIMAIVASFNNQ
jgi:hypothetical protein